MLLILLYELIKLLDGGDDNSGIWVFKLLLQNRGGDIGVGGAFFKAVVLFHGLVIKIFSIYDEENFVYCG